MGGGWRDFANKINHLKVSNQGGEKNFLFRARGPARLRPDVSGRELQFSKMNTNKLYAAGCARCTGP